MYTEKKSSLLQGYRLCYGLHAYREEQCLINDPRGVCLFHTKCEASFHFCKNNFVPCLDAQGLSCGVMGDNWQY